MSELDVPPWQQSETVPATAEWLDEGPFAAGAGTAALVDGEQPDEAQLGEAEAEFEDEDPGCDAGSCPADRCARRAGPPQAPPDPGGRRLHPPISRGAGDRYSQNPSVGYAQQLLNAFLRNSGAEFSDCQDRSPARLGRMQSMREQLRRDRQDPLVVMAGSKGRQNSPPNCSRPVRGWSRTARSDRSPGHASNKRPPCGPLTRLTPKSAVCPTGPAPSLSSGPRRRISRNSRRPNSIAPSRPGSASSRMRRTGEPAATSAVKPSARPARSTRTPSPVPKLASRGR